MSADFPPGRHEGGGGDGAKVDTDLYFVPNYIEEKNNRIKIEVHICINRKKLVEFKKQRM